MESVSADLSRKCLWAELRIDCRTDQRKLRNWKHSLLSRPSVESACAPANAHSALYGPQRKIGCIILRRGKPKREFRSISRFSPLDYQIPWRPAFRFHPQRHGIHCIAEPGSLAANHRVVRGIKVASDSGEDNFEQRNMVTSKQRTSRLHWGRLACGGAEMPRRGLVFSPEGTVEF